MKWNRLLLGAISPVLLLTSVENTVQAQSDETLLNRALRIVYLTDDDSDRAALLAAEDAADEVAVDNDAADKEERKSRRSKKKNASQKAADKKRLEPQKEVSLYLNVQKDGVSDRQVYVVDDDGKKNSFVRMWNLDKGRPLQSHAVAIASSKYILGVYCTPASDILKKHLHLEDALVINSVIDDSAASEAGLKEHDLLLSVNDDEVTTGEELMKLVNDAGEKELTLKIIRAGKKMTVQATPRERKVADLTKEVQGIVKGKNQIKYRA